MTDPKEAAIAEAKDLLRPHLVSVVRRVNVDEFTTAELIEVMQQDADCRAAYLAALAQWPESDETLAKMVVHGLVIPDLLRSTGLVEWAGYAHDEQDSFAIPAWWRKLPENA